MADIIVAGSEKTFQNVFETICERVRFKDSKRNNYPWGYIRIDYDGHLKYRKEGPDLIRTKFSFDGAASGQCPGLFPNCSRYQKGRLYIKNLDIYWSTLQFTIAFDIPSKCVGGICLKKVGGICVLRTPKLCVFQENPDLAITIPLELLFGIQELSLMAGPHTKRTATTGLAEKFGWEVFFIDPQINFNLIDLGDVAGDFVVRVEDAVMKELSGLPQWAKNTIIAIFDGIEGLLRVALKIGSLDALDEWILDKFQITIDPISGLLLPAVKNILDDTPVLQIEDPFDAGDSPKFNLEIPIQHFDAQIYDHEIVISIDVGV